MKLHNDNKQIKSTRLYISFKKQSSVCLNVPLEKQEQILLLLLLLLLLLKIIFTKHIYTFVFFML